MTRMREGIFFTLFERGAQNIPTGETGDQCRVQRSAVFRFTSLREIILKQAFPSLPLSKGTKKVVSRPQIAAKGRLNVE